MARRRVFWVDTFGRVYVCVVVAPKNGDDRFIVTAYFTKEIKKGREVWKR